MVLDKAVGMDSGTGEFGTAAFHLFGSRQFFADQADNPNNADWAVNSLAPAVADPANNGLTVRQFDDTTEQGVGTFIFVPHEATHVRITTIGRAQTAPGSAVNVVLSAYVRSIPNNAAVGSWSSRINLGTFAIPTNANFQYFISQGSFTSFGVTPGTLNQFEFTRDAANASDTLSGNFLVVAVIVEFF